jgi:hypothetical protein
LQNQFSRYFTLSLHVPSSLIQPPLALSSSGAATFVKEFKEQKTKEDEFFYWKFLGAANVLKFVIFVCFDK